MKRSGSFVESKVFLDNLHYETQVGSLTLIWVLKHVLFSLSLSLSVLQGGWCCRPSCSPKFYCSCCTHRRLKILIWMGRMQRWKQSVLDSVSLSLNGTHTHTHTAWFLILSTSPFLWENTDTPWMGPCGDIHCGWEVPSVTTAMLVRLKGQCWSLSHAVRSLFGAFSRLNRWLKHPYSWMFDLTH